MKGLTAVADAFLHLVFPHVCEGCGTDVVGADHFLCLRCLSNLPKTGFESLPGNPVEKVFWGRLPLQHATAQFYFTKNAALQHLLHQLKYRGNRELGLYLGRLMGQALKGADRFAAIDALVPLPLFPAKEKKRGYNQATLLCQGIAAVIDKPVLTTAVRRTAATESQTRKSRVQRWANMEGRFELADGDFVRGKHLLLVDDVVTTGATLEACGAALLGGKDVQLSVATLCYSSR